MASYFLKPLEYVEECNMTFMPLLKCSNDEVMGILIMVVIITYYFDWYLSMLWRQKIQPNIWLSLDLFSRYKINMESKSSSPKFG
jgi:hypothetical protein